MTTLLEIDGLEAGYGPIAAVRDARLTVGRGEIIALLGANGAGKTTTLACVAGLVASRAGVVRFDGEDISHLRPEAIVQRGISLAPEGRRLFTRLSVAENLRLGGASPRGRDTASTTRRRLEELFPLLRTRADTPAGLLSGGEQQQVAIARALMSRPRLLLLDEPTLGLAPKLIREIFRLIAQLRDDDDISILLVEQNVRQALRICDRAYVMRTGTIALHGTAADLRRSDDINRAYLGVAGAR
jgi:branched-chain amino acid transport system ATP-binding protein